MPNLHLDGQFRLRLVLICLPSSSSSGAELSKQLQIHIKVKWQGLHMQRLLWGNFIMQNAETLPAGRKSLSSTRTDLKILVVSLSQVTIWQNLWAIRQPSAVLQDGRVSMMTRKGKIKLSTCSQWFSLLLVRYFPHLDYWVTAILNVKIQLPCQQCQQKYSIKTRKQQTRIIE